MDIIDRARKYIAAAPIAVSGQGGHNQTFSVAVALIHGFALDKATAGQLLREYNSRCQPPWEEKDLEHKLKSAESTPHDKPRGHLRGVSYQYGGDSPAPLSFPPIKSQPEIKAPLKRYKLDLKFELPEPMSDPCRQFIMAAFQPGEGISIERATLNEEKKEIPEGKGLVLTREQWLKKLAEVDYDPNKIWRSTDRTGVFIRVNPTQGSNDNDVTGYRHALVEFDHISIEEQWSLIKQSNIPCAAILHSGGKSLHAWVRVDAKDLAEYKQRVQILYSHFEPYGVDIKNKNPSRFSRLPGMIRGQKRQELLVLNHGADSFASWQIAQEVESIGEEITIDELDEFVPSEDPNCLIGDRWLCRGGSCLIVGQSGIGKSSLNMQAALTWSLNHHLFGIEPKRSLKSLIVQAENDKGDLAEMYQGVSISLAGGSGEVYREMKNNFREMIRFVRISDKTGEAFCKALAKLIEKHKPDLVWIDPLLSFIGDDISKQAVCSQFLRNWLNPISNATGVAWMMIHHTGKPPQDKKNQRSWTANDYSYLGTGSSELVNWARAVMVLRQQEDFIFNLKLSKRGMRAGAKDFSLARSTDIHLQHSTTGICWNQVEAPVKEEKEKPERNRSNGRPKAERDWDGFAKTITEPTYKSEIIRRAADFFDCAESGLWEKSKWEQISKRLTFDHASDGFFFKP